MKKATRKVSGIYFPLEFQISREGWDFYELARGIFPPRGEISAPDFRILRQIVTRIQEKKGLTTFSTTPLRAGQLNATGLINEIFRCIIRRYCETRDEAAFTRALAKAGEAVPAGAVQRTVARFVEFFPPLQVLRGRKSAAEFLAGKTAGLPNTHIVTAELILLSLANTNPAFSPAQELFRDAELAAGSNYVPLIEALEKFFDSRPGFGREDTPLPRFLRGPILAGGDSLTRQLTFIKDYWRDYLTDELFLRILTAIDILKEEEKIGLLGHGPTQVLMFKGMAGDEYAAGPEYERFTEDRDWMSKVVLLAKSIYVWLDQLSAKYNRSVTRLDQIPDEELDLLARWGFTGLWLIGIWERSPASQTIKRICGNPEALSSAYSLYDYAISNNLGGEAAFASLKERAGKRGIRLATDVVPNHTGIYSKWVIEHPERFIQLDYPPYPSYRFSGADLSNDPRVALQIEDGYWTRRDAAVVFKRHDRQTGSTRYIYHGNDGTSMPWNDTAQLNFLREDVREAVIQTILGVARRFPIIRFDAAMTLAKKHFERLWFPHPGTGGGIPSRSEHGMMKEEFDRLMPKEFWREVVDRITRELPDTLLLAEAFWLMEGYFVRTLGMHRVYNSAFMNMLKMEENDKYRSVVKNVLEFDPRILKRFVNFMNNPDEETAVAQFGKGDKYFGVCLLMVTMPGLPMFGHGQIEGFREKYGMEYRRGYWHEQPDWDLVRRHEAEIFPLMRKRHLFSGVEHFVFYDFYRTNGRVNENVFAYSNRSGGERALIVYHNRYEETSGWIRSSCAMAVGADAGGNKKIVQKTLAEGLAIKDAPGCYYVFKNYRTGLEYLRSGRELSRQGLFVSLGAFHYHIFMDFREVMDGPAGYYRRLAGSLEARGVPSVEEALKELILSPVHEPLRRLIGAPALDAFTANPAAQRRVFKRRAEEFVRAIGEFTATGGDAAAVQGIMAGLDALIEIRNSLKGGDPAAAYLRKGTEAWRGFAGIALVWIVMHNIGRLKSPDSPAAQSAALMDELLLGKVIAETLHGCGLDAWSAGQHAALIKILAGYHNWYDAASPGKSVEALRDILNDSDARSYLLFNRHDGVLWYNKERMEQLLYWLCAVSALGMLAEDKGGKPGEEIRRRYLVISGMLDMTARSGCEVEKLLALISPPPRPEGDTQEKQ